MSSAESIAAAVAAALEGGRTSHVSGYVRLAEGLSRGVHVSARCRWMNGRRDWIVKAKGAAPPVLLTLRHRAYGDRGAIASGAILALPTGDAGFDGEWLVEGAPAETTRLLVDPALRAALAAAGEIEVSVDGGKVVASGGTGASYEAGEVLRTVEVVVRLRERLAALAAEPADEATLRRARQEVGALRVKQDRLFARASWPARIGMVLFVVVISCAAVTFLWSSCIPH
jgi:photosystem II stability/assembly factor-like uncharacterized protein